MMFSPPSRIDPEDRAVPRPFRRGFRPVLPLVMLTTLLAAGAAPKAQAQAQDPALIDKLVQLNKKAMDDYDTADFDVAKKSLLEAEKTGKRAGLEGHPVMARTYIHLGALYLVGFKDKAKAQHYFNKALDIQADIKLDTSLTSASVRDAFAATKAQRGDAAGAGAESLFPPSSSSGKVGGGKSKGGRAAVTEERTTTAAEGDDPAGAEGTPRRGRSARDNDAEPELPTTVTALNCPYPDDTPPGKKVTLRCVAAANLGIAGVSLFYKGYEMTDYEKVDMTKSSKGWWQVAVPMKRVDGKSLQFFFEGLNSSGKPVVSNGRAESPNVMLIVEKDAAAAAPAAAIAEEDENPLEENNRSPRFRLGKTDDSQEGLDTHFGNRRFWIGIGAGTGLVLPINGVLESRVCGLGETSGMCKDRRTPALSPDVPVSGFGWARLAHLVPEIGVQITPNWAISIEGRNQWIPQSKKVANYTASGAHSVLLKVIHYTKQKRTRLFYGVVGGGGEGVRMNIQSDDMNLELWDTVRVGRVLLGGTGGLNFEISRGVTWTAGVNAMYGFPAKGFAFDLNTGIQFNFGDTSGAAAARAAKKASSISTSVDDEDPT
ncbi:MAG: tetratricopeptide repeat protein [Myxococcales bacterium]